MIRNQQDSYCYSLPLLVLPRAAVAVAAVVVAALSS